MIAGMIAYPQIKSRMKASKDAAEVVPPAGSQVRKQVLNINAEVLKYQSLTDKTIVTGSTIPDEEVDLSLESSGKIMAIYFTEGTHVKAGDLLAKINDKPLQAELKKLEAQVPLAKDRVYRQHTLLEKDAVSQEAYEQVATEYEKLMAGMPSAVLNLGTGEGTSVKEMIEAAEKVTGKKLNVKYAGRRPGDPAVLIASSEKARELLGWKPEITNVEDIIRTTWNLESPV